MKIYYFCGSFSQNGSIQAIIVEDGIAYNPKNGTEAIVTESMAHFFEALSFSSKRI